jgi:peptidoglycan/LPS O-acetylase OafA/YrhL
MLGSSPTDRSHDLVELDALRGIAITLVFLTHVEGQINGFQAWKHGFGPWRAFGMAGHTGVSLFFILSGFLIGRPFLAELAGGPRVARTVYAARRVLRIMPLYVFYVVLAAIVNASAAGDVLRAVPYLFFLQAFPGLTVPLPNFSWVWWSLATEAHFYVLLPLAVAYGRRVATVALVAVIGLYAAFIAGLFPAQVTQGPNALAHSIIGRTPLFLYGLAAAAVYRTHGARLRAAAARVSLLRFGGADLLLIAILYVLGRLLRVVLHFNYDQLELVWPIWHLYEGALWCAAMLCVLLLPLRSKPLIVNRAWTTLGVLSYSLYMVHLPLVLFMVPRIRERWPGAVTGWSNPWSVGVCVAVAATAIAIATVTYLVIERPMLAWKARLRAPLAQPTLADRGPSASMIRTPAP